jgi:hypothetical protein
MRTSLLLCALAITSCVAVLGCAEPGDDTDSDGTGGSALSESPLAPQYAGLLRSEVTVRWDDGKVETLKTTVRGFMDADQNGSSLRLSLKACSFALPAVGGIAITLPEDVLQQRVPEVVLSGRIDTSATGTRFKTDETVVLVGLQNVRPGEPLPSDARDPRVVDQDGDREPGFSLRVKVGVSGRVFVGLRAVAAAEGEVASDGTIVAKGVLRYDFTKDIEFYGDSFFGVDAADLARKTVKRMTVIPGSEKYEIRMEPLRDGSFADVGAKCAAVAQRLP